MSLDVGKNAAADASAGPSVKRLADYRPPAYLVERVELHFRLAPRAARVTARLQMRPGPETPPGSALRLDGEDLRLKSIALDGARLDAGAYDLDEDGLTLAAPPTVPFLLETEVEIDPIDNGRLEGLYMSNGLYCTQCEAEGFRRISFFPDRPDVMATYTVTIDAPRDDCPVLLSNGNRVAQADLGAGWQRAVWEDPFPKPSYLFALVAGKLALTEDSFTTASGRDVALRLYVDPGNETKTAYAMDALKRSMRWDEEVFGLEYDLDLFNIVAVADFNMGAMENKSLNVFNAKYVLADPETATDADYAAIESIVAHEYFHNWTGNRVTCRDWFQLSLKEGLTVFRDQLFSQDMRSAAVQRIQDVRMSWEKS